MPYTFLPLPVISSGDEWTAANHNAFIRDNFAGSVPGAFTAKGDVYASTGTINTGEILHLGTNGAKLKQLSSAINGLAWLVDSPGAEIYMGGAQSIANDVDTTITFDTEVFDVGGFYPGSGDTITIPSNMSGLYMITATGYFELHATPGKFRQIFVTCSVAGSVYSTHPSAIGNQSTWMQVSFPMPLVAGETVIARCRQVSGGALNIREKRLAVVRIQ